MADTRTPKQIAADKVDELIERIEKADGPDQAIDTDICLAMDYGGENSVGATNVRVEADWDGDLLFEIDGEECCNPVPELTSSLDAAVALAERVLKIYRLELFMDPSGISAKVTWWPCGLHETDTIIKSEGMGWTPAVSICLATLKAVRAHMHPRDREETANG